jgi:hypothetical protein
MFGYVRPLKPELLVREFSRYKSIYCGICKQIGHDFGQLPRITLGYDLTMLAVLLLSLSAKQPPDELAGCIINPLARRPIARGGPVIELCAALTVLLAWHKADDDVRDEKSWRGRTIRAILRRSRRRAARRYPEYDHIMSEEMENLRRIEMGEPDPAAAAVFGQLLERLFTQAAVLVTERRDLQQAIGLFGRSLGRWIFLLDAIDDLTDDCDNGSWNPYSRMEITAARETAAATLAELELEMDRTAALFPYQRDGGLLANIVVQGLPATRQQVMQGEKLTRL